MKRALAVVELILGCVLMVLVMLMETETAVRFGIGFAVMTICNMYAMEMMK